MSKQITRKQAEAVLAQVREYLGTDEATLYEPGFHSGGWTIGFEGDYDWSVYFVQRQYETRTVDRAVFIEPVAGWCLGLYRA